MSKIAGSAPIDVRESILANGQRIMASKGFSAVGLNEVLEASRVPKGSFYHYFRSKESFGEALIARYFEQYLSDLDAILSTPGQTAAQRLLKYWNHWQRTQASLDCQGKCLAVKLAAEVVDLSEPMRVALERGTTGVVTRLAEVIDAGIEDGSLPIDDNSAEVAQSVYQLWLGASLMVKVVRDAQPFAAASSATYRMLNIPRSN